MDNNNKIMEYGRTAHNRSVYASLPSGGSGYGTLYEMAAKLFVKYIDKKY
jgi:hypothetical protein